jgi:hypothetical protein
MRFFFILSLMTRDSFVSLVIVPPHTSKLITSTVHQNWSTCHSGMGKNVTFRTNTKLNDMGLCLDVLCTQPLANINNSFRNFSLR